MKNYIVTAHYLRGDYPLKVFRYLGPAIKYANQVQKERKSCRAAQVFAINRRGEVQTAVYSTRD